MKTLNHKLKIIKNLHYSFYMRTKNIIKIRLGRLIFGLILTAYAPAVQIQSETMALVFQVITGHYQEVSWDRNSIIEVDVNCDKEKDYAILGNIKECVAVGLIVGPASMKSHIEFICFSVGMHTQSSLCQLPAMLKIESLDYDSSEEGEGKLPGFQRSKQCNTFCLADDTCDSFHFYWNHEANELQWWRL